MMPVQELAKRLGVTELEITLRAERGTPLSQFVVHLSDRQWVALLEAEFPAMGWPVPAQRAPVELEDPNEPEPEPETPRPKNHNWKPSSSYVEREAQREAYRKKKRERAARAFERERMQAAERAQVGEQIE